MHLANGLVAGVKQNSVPLGLKLHSAWGTAEIRPQAFAILPGDDVLTLGKITLGILRISPNAELDRIACNKFKILASAYQWFHSCRISVIFPAEDVAMTQTLESERRAPHDVGTSDNLHPKGEE